METSSGLTRFEPSSVLARKGSTKDVHSPAPPVICYADGSHIVQEARLLWAIQLEDSRSVSTIAPSNLDVGRGNDPDCLTPDLGGSIRQPSGITPSPSAIEHCRPIGGRWKYQRPTALDSRQGQQTSQTRFQPSVYPPGSNQIGSPAMGARFADRRLSLSPPRHNRLVRSLNKSKLRSNRLQFTIQQSHPITIGLTSSLGSLAGALASWRGPRLEACRVDEGPIVVLIVRDRGLVDRRR